MFINNPGRMTKMAAMPIYGKNPSKFFFSGTTGQISTKLGMKHRGLEYYNVFIKYFFFFFFFFFQPPFSGDSFILPVNMTCKGSGRTIPLHVLQYMIYNVVDFLPFTHTHSP